MWNKDGQRRTSISNKVMVPTNNSLATFVEPLKTTEGMTSRVVRSSLWTLGGQVVTLLVAFVSTPFVIRILGSESYGVLALINVLVGYLAFADVGMSIASTRFGAEANAHNDADGEAAVVWTSLVVALVPATIVAGVLALSAKMIVVSGLHLPEHLQRTAALALQLAAVGFIARTVSGVFNTPQLVRLRMDLNTLIATGISVAQGSLIILALLCGGGLVAASAVIVGVACVSMLAQAFVSQRLLPCLSRPKIKRELFRPLIRFGGALVVSSLAGMVLVQAEKVLLARFSSVTALAHYSVAHNLALILAVVPVAISQSLFPAFSRLQVDADREPVQRLYARALRGSLLWVIPIAVLLCLAAKPFFTWWAGPEYGRESTLPFYILICGLVVNVMAYIPHWLLMACGRSDVVARVYLSELLPYLLCAAVLTYQLGALGAAIAWSLRVSADAVLFFWFVRRISRFSVALLPVSRFSYAIAVVVVLLPLVLLFRAESSLAILASAALPAMLVYGVIVWVRVLTPEERLWMQSIIHVRKHTPIRESL